MAGDWIKIEHVTPDKPEVVKLASLIGIDQDAVVGKLLRLWIWADQQSLDGNALSVTESFIDRCTFQSGFSSALRKVGWLSGSDGKLTIPNFEKNNGETAKKRAEVNRRVSKHRQRKTEDSNANVTRKPLQKPLPEKRREEKSEKEEPSGSCPPMADDSDDSDEKTNAVDALWEISPEKARRRTSRKQVADEWKRIKTADRPDKDALVTALKAWLVCEEWQRDGGEFVPGLHLWIKRRQWENVPSPWEEKPKPRQTHEELIGGRKGTRIKISELPENTEPFDPQDDDIPF